MLACLNPIKVSGKVGQIIGLVVEGHGPGASIGEICEIQSGDNGPIAAEVVGFRQGKVLLMPLGSIRGVGPGCRITAHGRKADVKVGPALLGRILDGLGEPIDNKGPLHIQDSYPLYAEPLNPLRRGRISEPLDLGIRALNALFTCGKGQKMGIFSGSGVGKSILLSMVARNTKADVNVIALVGERGREVREFLEKNLGPEGLAGRRLHVGDAPLHVGESLQKGLFAGKEATILTSATLCVDKNFEHIKSRLGIGDWADELAVGSPFDYTEQALLYIPSDLVNQVIENVEVRAFLRGENQRGEIKLEDVLDRSLMRKLEDSGFIDRMYNLYPPK